MEKSEFGEDAKRVRGGKPRRTVENMGARGCTTEGIALIQALYELIDARYDSLLKLVDAVLAEEGEFAGIKSVKTLSNQMGDGGRYKEGPTWEVAWAIVQQCSSQGQRTVDLARIAGLWAKSHGVSRPPGYRGPVFAVDTPSDSMEHHRSLTAGIPLTRAPLHRCRRTTNRALVSSLVVVGLLWVLVLFVFSLDIDLEFPRRGDLNDAETLGLALVMVSVLLPAFAAANCYFGRIPLRWGLRVEIPLTSDRDVDAEELYGLDRNTLPRQRRLTGDLIWTLPAGAVFSTQLTVPRTWRRHLFPMLALVGGSSCLHGALGMGPNLEASTVPKIEWSLVDESNRLRAAGILPAPVADGQAWLVSFPGYGLSRARYLQTGNRVRNPIPDDRLAELCYFDLLEAGVTGAIPWPPDEYVTLVLRRLDCGSENVRVEWMTPGIHMHWGRRFSSQVWYD